MELLRNRGLHGRGLIEIATDELVARYNSALEMMGLTPTALTRFSVDMIGWSPEIAEEKGSTYYLTHSLANPTAIIVSINQRHAPVYFPYHSFDRQMIDGIYEKYASQIMDINTTDALCVDLDNGVSRYSSIEDVLLVDSFVMKVETPGGLIENCRQQKKLVERFMESDTLWEDEEERQKLINSGELYGDLRNRNVIIEDHVYSDVDIFFTEALGGVYIFNEARGRGQDGPLIVYRDRDRLQAEGQDQQVMRLTSIGDSALLLKLTREKYVRVDLQEYKDNPDLLEQKKEVLLAEYICSVEENYLNWPEIKKKNFIARHGDDIPRLYFELERLQKRLAAGENVFSFSLSMELNGWLSRPHHRIDEVYRPVIEQLLSEIYPSDPIRLFRYNKNRFYREYESYSECKKNWIVDYLNRRI